MNILLTAFEPFGGDATNPSLEALNRLSGLLTNDVFKTVVLPVSYDKAMMRLTDLIETFNPDVILMTGVAKGRKGITLERIAINIQDSQTPDNDQIIRSGNKINQHGPAAYFSDLPLETILNKIKDKDIPASISNSAGTFVCNTVMYHALDLIKSRDNANVRAGFIHVPWHLEGAVGNEQHPMLSLSMITEAIEIAIKVLIGQT